MRPSVAIRVDASRAIGTGHVARCLALANALRARGAEAVFLTRAFAGGGFETIRAAGFEVVALPVRDGCERSWLGASQDEELADLRTALSARGRRHAIVVDHYSLDARWERVARDFSSSIVAIDDLADRPHDCDILIDQNRILGGERAYRPLVPPGATLLLGPRYALLREEFVRAQPRLRDGNVANVLVFFGGVDAPNVTTRALDALAAPGWSAVTVDVVVGAGNPHAARITPRADARTRVHVSTNAIARLMEGADLALGAGGTASWERVWLGLPSLVAAIAPNQTALVRDMHAAGIAFDMGPAAVEDSAAIGRALELVRARPDLLAEMSRRSLEVIGDRTRSGADIVAEAMLDRVAA